MKMLTKAIEKSLPELYATEEIDTLDKVAQVKYFTPWTYWTWYGVEFDPKTQNFFGYVEGMEKEWGYFNLDELKTINGPFGLKVERDLYFEPRRMSRIIDS